MARALDREPHIDFPWLSEVKVTKKTVCRMSGKLPSNQCHDLFEEYFIPQTAPKDICNDHGSSWNVAETKQAASTNVIHTEKKKQEKVEKLTPSTKPPKRKKSVFSGDEEIDY